MMDFRPLHFANRLHNINPYGDVGVCTLWARPDAVLSVLGQAGVDMAPAASRTAVVANFYGSGFSELIRNLLFNPQIAHLLILGPDLSGSGQDLECFLKLGVDPVTAFGQDKFLIRGTERRIAAGFDPALLVGSITVTRLAGKITSPEVAAGIDRFFSALPKRREPIRPRLEVPLPEYKPTYFPSNPIGHSIVAQRPLDAWEQVVQRLDRFGAPVELEGGKRRKELLNLKVVVMEPVAEPSDQLAARGFDLAAFERYQRDILDDSKPPQGIDYTYGNRLRRYFGGIDAIEWSSRRLRYDERSREIYITLWDNEQDGYCHKSSPCLVSLFFRLVQDRLTLTATYRAHNAMDAWLKNLYGLMAIQQAVAAGAGLVPGPITVISHSVSINLDYQDGLERIGAIVADARPDSEELDRTTGKAEFVADPCGAFVVSIDRDAGTIIADLTQDGDLLVRYTGRTAQDVERQIARDRSISLLSHALYVGRELARAEARLKGERANIIDGIRHEEVERIAKEIIRIGAGQQTCNSGTATRWTDAAALVREVGSKG